MEEEDFYKKDIYGSEEFVDELMESDEIDPSEDAFMKGYDEDAANSFHRDDYDKTKLCPNCGEILEIRTMICNVCGQDIRKAVSLEN